jgi:MFS family permease
MHQPLLFIVIAVAISLGIRLFISRNNKLNSQLIDFSLFKNTSTLAGNYVTVIMGAFFHGFLFLISLVLQNNMNYSAANAGLLIFPFSILSALCGKFLFPHLLKRVTIPQIAFLGMCLMMTGGVALIYSVYLNFYLPVILLAIACVNGVGMAICFPSFTVLTLNEIPASHHGLASSVSTTAYFFGGGLGLSILGLFMQIGIETTGITILPVFVLCMYAFIGVIILLSMRTLKLSGAK